MMQELHRVACPLCSDPIEIEGLGEQAAHTVMAHLSTHSDAEVLVLARAWGFHA